MLKIATRELQQTRVINETALFICSLRFSAGEKRLTDRNISLVTGATWWNSHRPGAASGRQLIIVREPNARFYSRTPNVHTE